MARYSDAGWNYVFVGCDGAPKEETAAAHGGRGASSSKPFEVTTVADTPGAIAEKPFLVEREEGGAWRGASFCRRAPKRDGYSSGARPRRWWLVVLVTAPDP